MLRVTRGDARLRRAARCDAPCSGEVISRLINIYNGKPPSHLEFATARKVWGYASITTTHTSIAFLQRRIPSTRVNHHSRKMVGRDAHHNYSYVDRLSSEEKNPVFKNKPRFQASSGRKSLVQNAKIIGTANALSR